MSDSTSAAGAMLMGQVRVPRLVGVMLAGLGTSAGLLLPAGRPSRPPRPVQQTSSGASLVPSELAGAAIAELRRLSGFTWEQLSRLFKVSRRSLHFWASGKPMTPGNEEHLHRLLAVMRKVDRGSASANRAALLAVQPDGSIPFDLLAEGQYDRAVARVGPGRAPARVVPPPLSEEEKAARRPRLPDELAGALQDRVHADRGRLLAARPVRTRGK